VRDPLSKAPNRGVRCSAVRLLCRALATPAITGPASDVEQLVSLNSTLNAGTDCLLKLGT
jgi:hypothetical protein